MKIEVLSSDSEDDENARDQQDVNLEEDVSDDASQPPLQTRHPRPVPNTEQDSRVSVDVQNQAAEIQHVLQHEPSNVSDSLHDLLVNVVKPLFSTTRHPDLTSTGRKNLITPEPSKAGVRSNVSFGSGVFDPPPSWKNKWTMNLLEFILHKYNDIPSTQVHPDTVKTGNTGDETGGAKPGGDKSTRKSVLEAHFFLLVPPILNTIDSTDLNYKARGCRLLTLLCSLLCDVRSDMLKRTGLTEVFVDALRKNFVYLPTLTSEEDATMLLTEVYSAFLALIDARFSHIDASISRALEDRNESKTTVLPTSSETKTAVQENRVPDKTSAITAQQVSQEITQRQDHLTTLLRHSLLYSLNHLSTAGLPTASSHQQTQPSPASSSIAPNLTTFLLSQFPPIITRMGIYTAVHLPTLIPLLHDIMLDPFGTSTITGACTVLAGVQAIRAIVVTCWPRIQQKWWTDVLSAAVECWGNCRDELGPQVNTHARSASASDINDNNHDNEEVRKQREVIEQVQAELKILMGNLTDAVGDEMLRASQVLVDADVELAGLFEHGHGKENEHKNKT